jgi:pimeloyl-ACP methyl ester carboxylesterase
MLNQFMDIAYTGLQFGNEFEKYAEHDFEFSDGGFVEDGNLRYHYLHKGKKKTGQPEIIFLHGIVLNSNVWESYLSNLSRDRSVYALDFLGHGLSTKKPDLNVSDLVHQLHVFIREMDLKKPIIVGHSLGGLVGGMFASLYPEELGAFISISTVDYGHFLSDMSTHFNTLWMDMMYPLFNSFTAPFLIETIAQKVYNNKISLGHPDKESYLYHMKIKGSKKALFSLMKNYEHGDFSSEQYRKIEVPTLIIHGEKDQLIDCHNAEKLAGLIPHAGLEIIPDGSHMVVEEQEEKVRELIEQFIKNL